jgi:heme-degrading monooxygenase HmoA
MYIAMNRFKITPGREHDFEDIWQKRDTYLSEVPGFREFHLLKGSAETSHTLYVSHSTWDSKEAFKQWTHSDHFRKAHARAGDAKGIYLGHPYFEGFAIVL